MTFQDEELWICKACGGHHEGGPDGHLERFLQICESCLHDSPDPLAMVLKDILAQPPGDLSTAHGRELTAEVLYEIILSLSD